MNVEFLGSGREVGRSAVLIDDRLLLDCGTKPTDPPTYPAQLRGLDPDAVVVSHGHLDHAGCVPALLTGRDRPSVHWTPPTHRLTRRLAEDTLKLHGNTPRCPFNEEAVRRLGEVSNTHGYRESFVAAGYEITLFDAGHIPGSAHVLVDDGDTRLLYTADFHTDDQRLLTGTTARPEADAVICESTYSDVTHENRTSIESRFADSVRTTTRQGGAVVVPAFAIGRTQELLLVCAAHDIDVYVDGMGGEVTETFRQHPAYVRDADALARAAGAARQVSGGDETRRRLVARNNVVVTTSGMLSGGPAMVYVPAIRGNPVNKITLTGYQVEGTPGRQLLETNSAEINGRVMPVSAGVEWYDFSAHADREGLLSFLDDYRDAELLVNHGDRCVAFADELAADGYDAHAPANGDTVEL